MLGRYGGARDLGDKARIAYNLSSLDMYQEIWGRKRGRCWCGREVLEAKGTAEA